MSTETHQAELLARWLSESPAAGVRPEPPRGLDADVVDAVSALRPDRAPAPRLDIDDILFEVADGPLAEAVDPAAVGALGALLDEGDLVDALDPDVLDAVSVLRPDRAPAARVSIDDILAEVKTGPLAAGAGAPAGPAEVLPPSVPAAATDLPAPANTERPRGRMPGWLWPSLGGIAVAATALLFVAPMADTAMEAPPVSSAPVQYEGADAAMPAAEPVEEEAAEERAAEKPREKKKRAANLEQGTAGPMAGAASTAPATTRSAPAKDRLGDAGAIDETRNQLESLGYVDGSVAAGPMATTGDTRTAAAPSGGSAGLIDTPAALDDDFAYGVGGLAAGADKDDRAGFALESSAPLADAEAPMDAVSEDLAPPAPAATPTPRPEAEPSPDPAPMAQAPARKSRDRADQKALAVEEDATGAEGRAYGGAVASGDAADDDLEYEEAGDIAVTTETVSRGGGGALRRTSRPKARKAKRAEAPQAASEPPPPEPTRASGDDLSSLRSDAWPLSAPASTRSKAPEGWAAVDAARASGDPTATIAALDALLRGPDDAVAQEAAWELARLHLGRGRRDLALVSVARGLERPGGHPLARARLLALQGEILEQRGDPSGAAESYKRAIRAR